MRKIAVDCDLRTSYAVDSRGMAHREATAIAAVAGVLEPGVRTLVLFEIASPLDYTDDKAVAYNKRRWTIWNVTQAVLLHAELLDLGVDMLVSPSHAWTKGFPLAVRHKMAGCRQPKKDLREAEAMLWFHAKDPAAWIPLHEFLANL